MIFSIFCNILIWVLGYIGYQLYKKVLSRKYFGRQTRWSTIYYKEVNQVIRKENNLGSEMVLRQSHKIWYGLAGGGVAVGLLIGYLQEGKKNACASWTTNFTPSTKWDSNWDRRDASTLVRPVRNVGDPAEENRYNESVEKVKANSTRHLILIRHGQYNMNGTKDCERQLTALGREQAELTGRRLKELNYKFTRIVQSTMTRAKETASIIHKHLPHLPLDSDELLREGAPIPPEPPVGHWKPEAKQFFEDGARIEAAFRKYFHRADASQDSDSYELLVCHANVIRYFICRALQFPPEAWLRFSLHNCSLTWISLRPNGRVVVYTIGDCGHIPVEQLSTT